MFINDFTIETLETTHRTQIGDFVKKYHYLKSLARGCRLSFVLRINGEIKGVAMFGIPTGSNVRNLHGNVLELKRFVLNECPKNTCSWFMAKCITHIKRNTDYIGIISYADPAQGHEGIIYKASNFSYLGKQNKNYCGYMFKVGRKYIHQRAAYQKGTSTYNKVMEAKKDGTLKKKRLKPKHIYLYNFIR